VEAKYPLLVTPKYTALMVPHWVRNPTMVPRRDRRSELLVRVTRRFEKDEWMILPEHGVLVAFRILGEGNPLGDPRDVRFEVHVPQRVYMDFRVRHVLTP
jgi:hypothetical protein